MSTILEAATLSIQTWNEVRNDGFATRNFFNQGAYFEISRESFDQWNAQVPTPEFIHAYMGLVSVVGQPNLSLTLFCVDSITDSEEVSEHQDDFNANLKQSIYQRSILPNAHFIFESTPPAPEEPQIDTLTALKASNQWILNKDSWLLEQEDFVQVFEIPFLDLTLLFANETVNNIVALPGLKDLGNNNFQIDLMLWGSTEEGLLANYPMDFIRPAPPFSNPSNFQLLAYALGA
jgi:hypothetical protein